MMGRSPRIGNWLMSSLKVSRISPAMAKLSPSFSSTVVAERFTLKSVLMGSTPLANLSDKIVREGESILVQPESVEFRVVSIEPDSVTLFASEPRFELSLQIEVILVRE